MRLVEFTEALNIDRKGPRTEPWSLPTWPERKKKNERASSSENVSWSRVRSHFKLKVE